MEDVNSPASGRLTTGTAGAVTMLVALLLTASASAQSRLSLNSAVDLALRNSPKVKMAQAELKKAHASLAETKDAFVPIVETTAGVGKSSGPPLAVPVVFSASAQSLVFNFSQRDYIRAASAGVMAAELNVAEASDGVVEDTVSVYVSLNNAERRKAVLDEALADADKLAAISQQRFDSGVDAHGEVSRSHVMQLRLKLQKVQVQSEIEELTARLSRLAGLPVAALETVPDSIPAYAASPDAYTGTAKDSPGMRAAAKTVDAKWHTAHGDKRYLLLPQVSFGANYSRITTAFTNYDLYYPAFNRNAENNENALSLGIQITLPLLDMMHRAKARGSAAEALRSQYELEDQRMQFLNGRDKLASAVTELSVRAELAAAEQAEAQDDLDMVRLKLKADAAALEGPPMNPKDEQNARLQERQKYLEMLNAELQLRQNEILLMRQNRTLGEWLHSGMMVPVAVGVQR